MWHTLRIYDHAKDKKGLILDGIRPVIDKLRGEGLLHRVYFLRHWVRGPHIRLNMECDPDTFRLLVRPRVVIHLENYFREHPSSSIDEKKLLPYHQELAKMELVNEPLSPFYPNQSIQDAPYDTKTFLGKEGLRLKEDYCTETYDFVIHFLERARHQQEAFLYDMIHLMVGMVASINDIRRTYLSFRSHSESMLHAYDRTGKLRAYFQSKYKENRESIHKVIIETIRLVETGNSFVDPIFKEWIEFVKRFYAKVKELVLQGKVRPPLPQDLEPHYRKTGVPEQWVVSEHSDFHNLLYSQKNIESFLDSPYFKSFRLMLNFLYTTFSQLGVKPIERFYLGFLVANAVEDIYGINWRDQLNNLEVR